MNGAFRYGSIRVDDDGIGEQSLQFDDFGFNPLLFPDRLYIRHVFTKITKLPCRLDTFERLTSAVAAQRLELFL